MLNFSFPTKLARFGAVAGITFALCPGALGAGRPATKTKSTASKTAAAEKTAAKKPAAAPHSTAKAQTTSGKSAAKGKTTASTHRKSRGTPKQPSQAHPEPERYAEIQKALADRGYYKGQATGEWNNDSVDALRRFQSDQKLPNDGRITALSLTALGLGPRHDGTTASTVPPPTAEPGSPAEPPPQPQSAPQNSDQPAEPPPLV